MNEHTAPVAADDGLMIVIEAEDGPFWQRQKYTAYLVTRTERTCSSEAAILAGVPSMDSLFRHESFDEYTRFIVESEDIVDELGPETAPLLVTPSR